MKTQFRMFARHGIVYCEDAQTRKQQSLKTRDRREATRLLHARNEAQVNPAMNLQIARAYPPHQHTPCSWSARTISPEQVTTLV